jgi:excisionase family DNA binding protein
VFATIDEVAQRLRCSTQSVRRIIRDGDLPVVELPGRLLLAWADVDAYVESRRTVRTAT